MTVLVWIEKKLSGEKFIGMRKKVSSKEKNKVVWRSCVEHAARAQPPFHHFAHISHPAKIKMANEPDTLVQTTTLEPSSITSVGTFSVVIIH